MVLQDPHGAVARVQFTRCIFWDGCAVSVNVGCQAASSGLGAELNELALPFQGFINKPAVHNFVARPAIILRLVQVGL